jgi:hypothetical protein
MTLMLTQSLGGGAVRSGKSIVDRLELEARGWTIVEGITTSTRLLEVACSLGRPVPSPTGELIKQLTPRSGAVSRKQTLSAAYGMGEFPLHTDTAFWPLPCRYLIFRATGDVRRHTTVLTFARLLTELGSESSSLAERSIWLARTPERSFYCSMTFAAAKERCWRYDTQCMVPVNKAAKQIEEKVRCRIPSIKKDLVRLADGVALVLCNWKVLHGRGPMPVGEKIRILERVYVE